MSTFFGISADTPDVSLQDDRICLSFDTESGQHLLPAFQHMNPEDVLFLKSYSEPTGMEVSAMAVVLSGHPRNERAEFTIPVRWLWEGQKHIDGADENNYHRQDMLYEEFDLKIQRDLIDLVPAIYQTPREW